MPAGRRGGSFGGETTLRGDERVGTGLALVGLGVRRRVDPDLLGMELV